MLKLAFLYTIAFTAAMAGTLNLHGIQALAPPQSIVAGTTNLGGVQKTHKLKYDKNTGEWYRDPKYKEELRNQVKAMKATGSQINVLTEINPEWYSWLESEFQTDPDFREWKLYHDGNGVAIMQGPEIEAHHEPAAVKAFDRQMLLDDPADNDRLDWRIIFYGKFNLRGRPFFPCTFLVCIFMPVRKEKTEVLLSKRLRKSESRLHR